MNGQTIQEFARQLAAGRGGQEAETLMAAFHQAGGASAPALVTVISRFLQLDLLRLPAGRFMALALVRPADYSAELAQHDIVSTAGAGASPVAALVRCAGEAAEHLSQLIHGDEKLYGDAEKSSPCPPAAEEFADYIREREDRGQPILWTPAVRLGDRAVFSVPAWLVYRFPNEEYPPFPLSIGCAAGPSEEDAVLAALLELIERDAVALWWQAGMPAVRERVSAQATPSPPWRLWLAGSDSYDIAAPVCVALSPGQQGDGFVCAAAAGTSYDEAGKAATRELAMFNFAQVIARDKEAEGARLNAVELQHLARSRAGGELSAHRLSAAALEGDPASDLPGEPAAVATERLLQRLAASEVEVFLVDTQRGHLGIPSARVLTPRLQPYPAHLATPRLSAARACFGGGPGERSKIDAL